MILVSATAELSVECTPDANGMDLSRWTKRRTRQSYSITGSIQEAMMCSPGRDGLRTRQISSRDSSRALQFGQNKKHERMSLALSPLGCLPTIEQAQHSLIKREKS